MKKLWLSSLIPIGIALSLSACSPIYYAPNAVNIPLISAQNEKTFVVNGNENQVNFSGAYGLTSNFSMMASGALFFVPEKVENGSGGSGNIAEVGAGYFTKYGNNIIFESYAIFGFGSVENHFPHTANDYPSTKGDISSNLIRFGIQPNIGYKSKHFNIAYSMRVVGLHYTGISGDLIFKDVDQVTYLESNRSNFLMEPSLMIEGGFQRLKLQLQATASFNLTNVNFKSSGTIGTIGLNYRF